MAESRITEQRWWDLGVALTSVAFAVILFVAEPTVLHRAVGFAALGAFTISWFTFGRRHQQSTVAAIAMVAVVIVVIPCAVWAQPSLAIMQCITYPLLWTLLTTLKSAIASNIAHATGIGTALYLTTGADAEALLQAVGTELISVAFSIVLGLWITSIAVRSHERQLLVDELRTAQDKLSALSRDAGVTSERERLAREIHDTIAQDLTGLVLLAQRAGRELSAGGAGGVGAAGGAGVGANVGATIALLEESARTALAETRALVASSAPPALDGGGIAAALHRLGDRFARETGIQIDVDAESADSLERDLEVVVLRCAQEGLANIRKHSGATRAAVVLHIAPTERSLRISDNGSGFDLTTASDGFGLSGMRERLALVGGTLSIETGEEGTTLLITLPRGGDA